jgi:hypothetical protein
MNAPQDEQQALTRMVLRRAVRERILTGLVYSDEVEILPPDAMPLIDHMPMPGISLTSNAG